MWLGCFLPVFSSFCLPLVLYCVCVPFFNNVDICFWCQNFRISGLSVSLTSSGAMNSVLESLINSSVSSSLSFCTVSPIRWIFGLLRYHCQYENIFFGYYSRFNSLLINSSQLHCNEYNASSKMLVIHKWSRKYTNKQSITKHVLKVSNDVILMLKIRMFIGHVTQWWQSS